MNEARVYDFYQRQADYYMENPNLTPKIIPAYPGLDAGLHGHWGKHNQNNHNDGRWNDGDTGEHFAHVVKGAKNFNVEKGVCVKLGEGHLLSTCFDPQSLTYRAVWQDGWVKFRSFPVGIIRGATIDGKTWYQIDQAKMPSGGEYIGLRRYGNRVVFEYKIGQTKISDEPWASKSGFYRRIDFAGLSGKLELPCPIGNGYLTTVVQVAPETKAEWKDGELSISGQSQQGSLILKISAKGNSSPDPEVIAHLNSPAKNLQEMERGVKHPRQARKSQRLEPTM